MKDSEDGDADGCEGHGLGKDRYMYQVDEDPETRNATISADCPAGAYTLRASISNSDNEELASATAGFYVLPPPDVYEVEEVEQPEEEEPVSGEQNAADATLSALTVSPTDIHGFPSDVTEYHVGVANSVTQATITATANNANATIDISGTPVASGTGYQANLDEGGNLVEITVTSEDGNSVFGYYIYVARGVTADFGWKASDEFNGLVAADIGSQYDIWSDGTTMWMLGRDESVIYAFDAVTKARDPGKDFDTLVAAQNLDARGIWSDGTTMWVTDIGVWELYAYNVQTKARDRDKDFDTLADSGNYSPRGIWSDGTTMWVVGNGARKIYAYNAQTKAPDPGKDFNTLDAAGNTSPTSIWSDGATMWVVDSSDSVLYAYDMATKAHDSGKGFGTNLINASNRHPYGIWSDGTTMWVTDLNDDKMYSYNMPPSANANLESISVNGLPVSGVNRLDTEYTHTVAVTETTVTLSAPAAHPGASVSIIPADSAAAGHQVALHPDGETPTEVTITVTAEDDTSTGPTP